MNFLWVSRMSSRWTTFDGTGSTDRGDTIRLVSTNDSTQMLICPRQSMRWMRCHLEDFCEANTNAVSFKRWDEISPLQPRDAENFEGCQNVLDAFDEQHPLGSLPYDKPEDMRLYKETSGEARARRSSRRKARRRG